MNTPRAALPLVLILLTLASPSAATPVTYYFAADGNNRNDGLSPEHPKQSVQLLTLLLENGGTARLRRGDTFSSPGLRWEFGSGALVRIEAYGDPALPRPIVSDLIQVDAPTWRSESDGTWSAPLPVAGRDLTDPNAYVDGQPLALARVRERLSDGTFCIEAGRLLLRSFGFTHRVRVELAAGGKGPMIRARRGRIEIAHVELAGGPGWRAAQGPAAGAALSFDDVAVKTYRNRPPVQYESGPGLTYYFSTSGSDNNNGLSDASPKKTLSLIPGLVHGGNTALLKRGDVWYQVGALVFDGNAGTSTYPMVVGAYGEGSLPRPVVAGGIYRDSTQNRTAEGGKRFSMRQTSRPGT